MEPVTWGFIGTLFGAFIGAAASVLTTYIAAQNTRQMKKDEMDLERQESSRKFQLNNFTELQNALAEFLGLTHKVHLEVGRATIENKSLEDVLINLDEKLNQDILRMHRQLSILNARILDDKLRENVESLRQEMFNTQMAQNYDQSLSSMNKAKEKYAEVIKEIGVHFRAYQ